MACACLWVHGQVYIVSYFLLKVSICCIGSCNLLLFPLFTSHGSHLSHCVCNCLDVLGKNWAICRAFKCTLEHQWCASVEQGEFRPDQDVQDWGEKKPLDRWTWNLSWLWNFLCRAWDMALLALWLAFHPLRCSRSFLSSNTTSLGKSWALKLLK